MSIRNLICVSGTCVALSVAAAPAQQDTTRQPDRTPTTRPLTTSPDTSIGNLLEKRQGVWQVDVMLNKDFWSKMHRGGAAVDQRWITTPGEKPADRQNDPLRDPNRDPAGNPDAPDTDRPDDYPWKTDQDKQNQQKDPARLQPGAAGQQGITTTPQGMMRLNGYAESNLVLDNKILQERIVVPMGADVRFHGDNPGNQPGNQTDQNRDQAGQNQTAHPDTMGKESFSGISLIEFNESDHTYDMVFLCNMSEGIQYDSGYFDAQRNRIVFRGRSGGQPMDHNPEWRQGQPDRQPGERPSGLDRTDPSRTQPHDQNRSPAARPGEGGDMQRAARPGMDNFVVVLELVDDNTHKVTMYDTSRGSGIGADQDWRNQPRDLDDRDDIEDRDEPGDIDEIDDREDALDDDNNPANRDPANRQPADPQRITSNQPGMNSEFGAIVYQATYTRAPATMEARIRSIIDDTITVASR